ncbi:MAG: Gfo/Idh/MocA family oxidoreductase [Bacteroidota bacterium]
MLKIGVLGAGQLGKIHIKCIQEICNVELIGFFDSNFEHAQIIAKEYHTKLYSSMESLIADADVITIATPTNTHFECAFYTLKKSKHVFIEKPLTNSIEEAKILMDIAREANVKVQVGHVERFNAAFIASQPYIQQPMFIETHRLAHFNSINKKESVILDLMIDDIDIIISIVKSNIRKISASGVAVVSETPDIANARIEFDNGCVANITASRISLKNMQKMRIFQRDAYISMDFLSKESEIIKIKNIDSTEIPSNPNSINFGLNNENKQLSLEKPNVIDSNSIKTELESFISSIIENKPTKVPIFEGYQALDVARKILEKIELSSGC